MKNEVKYETRNGRTVKKSETVDGVAVSVEKKPDAKNITKPENKKNEE